MTDYAVTPIQPIVQGLVTIPSGVPGGPAIFTGKGALPTVTRDPASLLGAFILTLDVGLPGNAGALQPLPNTPGVTSPAVPDARTMITVRGDPAIAPPTTTITQVAVAYLPAPPPAPGVGINRIEVVLSILGVPTDPVGTGGSGFEVIVWKGIEGP